MFDNNLFTTLIKIKKLLNTHSLIAGTSKTLFWCGKGGFFCALILLEHHHLIMSHTAITYAARLMTCTTRLASREACLVGYVSEGQY